MPTTVLEGQNIFYCESLRFAAVWYLFETMPLRFAAAWYLFETIPLGFAAAWYLFKTMPLGFAAAWYLFETMPLRFVAEQNILRENENIEVISQRSTRNNLKTNWLNLLQGPC